MSIPLVTFFFFLEWMEPAASNSLPFGLFSIWKCPSGTNNINPDGTNILMHPALWHQQQLSRYAQFYMFPKLQLGQSLIRNSLPMIFQSMIRYFQSILRYPSAPKAKEQIWLYQKVQHNQVLMAPASVRSLALLESGALLKANLENRTKLSRTPFIIIVSLKSFFSQPLFSLK